ncbi:MAG: glycosyl hydrolase family 18 protein [Acidimicrobiales bacterium]
MSSVAVAAWLLTLLSVVWVAPTAGAMGAAPETAAFDTDASPAAAPGAFEAAPGATGAAPEAGVAETTDRSDRRRGRSTDAIWLPWWLSGPGIGEVAANAGVFDDVSLFAYDERGCGDIASTAVMTDPSVIARAQQAGLDITATITATGLRPRQAIRCLGDPVRRRTAVRAVLAILDRHSYYTGIDLNYEHLALTTSPRQAQRVREAYNAFVTQLCRRVEARGRDCIVTVMPRTSHGWTVWRDTLMPAVYDYRTLGEAADRVRIMGYDQHVDGRGPIGGMPWIRRITAFALREIPPERIELGIATYGRVWSPTGVTAITAASARALAARVGAEVRFHPRQREATFSYISGGRRHRVWFSSAASVAARRRHVERLGLAGAVYWSAGMAEPGTWSAVQRAAG